VMLHSELFTSERSSACPLCGRVSPDFIRPPLARRPASNLPRSLGSLGGCPKGLARIEPRRRGRDCASSLAFERYALRRTCGGPSTG
jgi:hypothetical protein